MEGLLMVVGKLVVPVREKRKCYFETMNQPGYYLFLLYELHKTKNYGKMQRKPVAELGA